MKRYSEDMNFSLLEKNLEFNQEKYFPAIIEEAKLLGREVVIKTHDREPATQGSRSR